MIKLNKYLLGTGVIALLLMITLYSVITHKNDKSNVETKLSPDLSIEQESNESVSRATEATEDGLVETENSLTSIPENNTEESKNPAKVDNSVESDIEELVEKYYDLTQNMDGKILTPSSEDEIEKRKDYFTRKKEIIEKYENIKNYIRPGLTEDTYVVFTTYEIKLNNIETLVPGMSVLTMMKDETGAFLIDASPNSEEKNAYIDQITSEQEIKTMINDVNTRLTEAMKEDVSLKKFVNYLKELS